MAQTEPTPLRRRTNDANADPYELRQIQLDRLHIQPVGLDLRHVEHHVDHAEQMLPGRHHGIQPFGLRGAEAAFQGQQLGIAEKPMQRRAQLVRHACEEAGFCLVRLLGLAQRLGEIARQAIQLGIGRLRGLPLAQVRLFACGCHPDENGHDDCQQQADQDHRRTVAHLPGHHAVGALAVLVGVVGEFLDQVLELLAHGLGTPWIGLQVRQNTPDVRLEADRAATAGRRHRPVAHHIEVVHDVLLGGGGARLCQGRLVGLGA